MECTAKYFKCPGFYCIPFRYVCNGLWECPGGIEEQNCRTRNCLGLFKCIDSTICISPASLCDGTIDCPHGDDIRFCNMKLPVCPSSCTCLLYSLFCINGSDFNVWFLSYATVIIFSMPSPSLTALISVFSKVVILKIQDSGIRNICNKLSKSFSHNSIHFLDTSRNNVRKMNKNCFRHMPQLVQLNMSSNRVQLISSYGFNYSKDIRNIDLSSNRILELNSHVFWNLYLLDTLNLSRNFILLVHMHSFSLISDVNIKTNNFRVCCASLRDKQVKIICNQKPVWPHSCGRLLDGIYFRVLIWSISISGLFLNIFGCICLWVIPSHTGKGYKVQVTGIALSDSLYNMFLLTIAIADAIFGDNYFGLEYSWTKSMMCIIAALNSILSSFLSTFSFNLLTLARYYIVKYPFVTRIKSAKYVSKVMLLSILVCFSIALLLIVLHLSVSKHNNLATGLCLLIGGDSVISQITTVLTIITQSVSVLLVSTTFIFLYIEVRKSVKVQTNAVQNIKRSLVAVSTNIACWIPSIVLLSITLFWTEYPYRILIFTIIVIVPLNGILNPFALIYSSILQDALHYATERKKKRGENLSSRLDFRSSTYTQTKPHFVVTNSRITWRIHWIMICMHKNCKIDRIGH